MVREFAYVPVVGLLLAAVLLATRRGAVPLALRGVLRMIGRDRGLPPEKPEPVSRRRRFAAFALVILAFALCLAIRAGR